jgi:hypothetical protein
MKAASAGDVKALEKLSRGWDAPVYFCNLAFSEAVMRGHVPAVAFLARRYGGVLRGAHMDNLLHAMVRRDRKDMAIALLEAGANPNSSFDPLFSAVSEGRPELLQVLMTYGGKLPQDPTGLLALAEHHRKLAPGNPLLQARYQEVARMIREWPAPNQGRPAHVR